MAGLLHHDGQEAVKQLKAAIEQAHVADCPLHLKSDINGKLISDPSLRMPGIAHFDTTHSRSLYEEPRDLMLCHIFFEAPGLTR